MTISIINTHARGFYNHFTFAMTGDIKKHTGLDHTPRLAEKCATKGLTLLSNIPKHILQAFKNPRVLTPIITFSALYWESAVFYPTQTWKATAIALKYLTPFLPGFQQIRFMLWATSVTVTLLYSIRAFDRFCNKDLLDKWYQKSQPVIAPPIELPSPTSSDGSL